MNIWLILLLGGLLTFGIRFSFIYLFGRVNVPDVVGRALHLVPPAVLSALVLPELLMPNGSLDIRFANHRWLAGLIAVVIAWRTRSVLLTIVTGMIALLILQFLVP